MQHHLLSIDGRAVDTEARDPVIDPARGAPFATAARAGSEHLELAIAAASRALAGWRRDEAARRAGLQAAAAALKAKASVIGPLLSREQGKPEKAAVGEVLAAAKWLAYFAELPTAPEIVQDDADKRIEVVRRPLGVVAAITPWNFPVVLLAWKLGPALLAGNTVVAKPSPYTPLSALAVGEALREVLPPGVLNVIAGGNELGAAMTVHPAIRKISFTGSIATGKRIMAAAADDLKRITLELGGNDPAIVLPDVDPKAVAAKLFWGAFFNSGQVCVGIKRLFLHEQVHDEVLDALVEIATRTRVGPGDDKASELGPLNNEPQLQRVIDLVDDARRAGAKVVAGGARLDGPGYFYPPTLVAGAEPGMRLVDEEQFGTALPILRYRDVDGAIEEANRTHFGLGASVWTRDLDRGAAIARELEAGTTWVNHHQDLLPAAPFGGLKWSGVGVEGGRWAYNEHTAVQVINVKKR